MNTELLKSKLLEAAFNGTLTNVDTSEWKEMKLGDLMNICTGKKDANFGAEEGEYVFFTCSKIPLKSKSYSYDGDYLIMPGNGANIGKVVHYTGKFEAYQRTYLMQAKNDDVDMDFVKFHLMCNWEQYNNDKVFGAATPFIKLGNLTEYPISLPPVIEQKKIVAAIEEGIKEIDAISKAKMKIVSCAEHLRKKILQSAFDGSLIEADTSKWKNVIIQDLCDFDNGYAFASGDYKKEGTPLIRISNIQNNGIDLSDAVCIQGDYPERFIVNNGDLLVAMSGATTGKMGVYSSDKKAYLNQRVGKIRIKDENILLPLFRNYYFQYQTEHILQLANGSAQPNISGKQILGIPIPLPPHAEQKRIVAKIEELFAEIDKLTK